MKVKQVEIGYTGEIEVGYLSFFIDLDLKGINMSIDELIEKATYFNRIVITGDEPFEQREELITFIKKIKKINEDTIITIYTNGKIKPVGIGNIDNIIFNIELNVNSNTIKFENRFKENIINWFKDVESNFIFNVKDEDELDKANLIIKSFLIKKKYVFIRTHNSSLYDNIKIMKYNIILE